MKGQGKETVWVSEKGPSRRNPEVLSREATQRTGKLTYLGPARILMQGP